MVEVGDEVEVLMELTQKLQEEDVRHCFRRDAAAWVVTERRTDSLNEKKKLAQSGETKRKHLLHDRDTPASLASEKN